MLLLFDFVLILIFNFDLDNVKSVTRAMTMLSMANKKYAALHENIEEIDTASRGPIAEPKDPNMACNPIPLDTLFKFWEMIVNPVGWYILQKRPKRLNPMIKPKKLEDIVIIIDDRAEPIW